MTTRLNIEQANDVNGTPQMLRSVASGNGGSEASRVVNQRKPCSDNNRKQISLKMGTWNVRTMLRQGKLANVIREMERENLDILGLCETRWKTGGDFNSEGIRVIYTGGEKSQRGVGILLNARIARTVKKVERHEDRILVVTLEAEPVDIIIVQVYMPTTDYPDEEVENIYESLENIIEKEKGTSYLLIMGDWNAVVGKGRQGKCVGNFGLGIQNERGAKLIEFCNRQKLIVTNTWFKHDKRRQYTWRTPGNGKRYQLDYIMVRERYRNSVKNSHSYPGADADTDHNLVAMKATIKLKFLRQRKEIHPRWDLEQIKQKKQIFAESVEEDLKTNSQHDQSINGSWNVLKDAILVNARKDLGFKNNNHARKPWVTTEMIAKMDERRKWKRQNTEEATREYKRLNNELRRETDKAKEKWWTEQCEEIEELQGQAQQSKTRMVSS